MYHEYAGIWKDLLYQGLKEDGWPWDWTSLGIQSLSPGSPKGDKKVLKAKVIAKSEGIWAGESLVVALNQLGKDIRAVSKISDGDRLKIGAEIVEIEGTVVDVLALERPFLNLSAHASGIATATFKLVEIAKRACPEQPPRIALTRKTLPGYRDVAILAVQLGGGSPHRVNLAGGILIKENHIAAAGSILKAVQSVKKIAPHGLKVEVEVRSVQEAEEALDADAEGILLDNFSPAQVSTVLRTLGRASSRPVIEVSGGLTESNLASYSLPGVDVLSVGSLTHSVKSVDLSLLVYG